MEGLIEGRIVHFVLENSIFTENFTGKNQTIENIVCRPAIIVNAWEGKLEAGMVNLQVFLDGSNDKISINIKAIAKDEMGNPCMIWKTSVKYSETKEAGTWHWPERT